MNPLEKSIPCKPNCPDRCATPNCHATCQRYILWRKDLDNEKQKILDYNIKNGIKNMKLLTSKSIQIYRNLPKRKDGY